MKLPKLYSRTSSGQIQTWEIEVIDNAFKTHEGILDGKITTSLPTFCDGKNMGKLNETSPEEQAIKEARAKWKKKVETGYFESIKDVDNIKYTEPMLAKKYEDYKDELTYPLYCQPKLDGCRCIVKANGMWSRNGKQFVSVPHIYDILKPIIDANPGIEFDGELYADKFNNDFNEIVSLVKKTKPTKQDIEDSKKSIQYWVYDIASHTGNFSERSEKIKELLTGLSDSIVIVPTYKVNSEKELTKYFEEFIENSYEGQMVRLDKPYENKRSKTLLKRKEFTDDEYEIVDICEGAGGRTGTAGWMVLKMPDGRTFKSNVKGSFKHLKQILDDKDKLIGEMATCKYFNLTPDAIPRFGFVTSIRNYE